ncbi:MAG: hypothetical protein GY931_11525 [Maribacter sp.]|nr:hypothetical protein [Maribacter sp.]
MTKLKCGCVPDASGFGYCGECVRALRRKIWRKMDEGRKGYDRTFAPKMVLDIEVDIFDEDMGERGCSCHINPPCFYCVDKDSGEKPT